MNYLEMIYLDIIIIISCTFIIDKLSTQIIYVNMFSLIFNLPYSIGLSLNFFAGIAILSNDKIRLKKLLIIGFLLNLFLITGIETLWYFYSDFIVEFYLS